MRSRIPLLCSNLRPGLEKLGVQEALQVFFVHFRLARRDVVQLAGLHPVFQLIHQAEQMVEGVDDEQQRLVVVDLEA